MGREIGTSGVLRKGQNYPIGKCSPTKGGICHELPPVFNPARKSLASNVSTWRQIPPDSPTQEESHFYMWCHCQGLIVSGGFQSIPPMAGGSPQPVPPFSSSAQHLSSSLHGLLPPVAVSLSMSPCHLPVLSIYCRVSGISPEWLCVGTSCHTSARAPFPGLQQRLGQNSAALSQAQPHITSPCAMGGENLRGLGAQKGSGGRCHRGCHRGLVPAPGQGGSRGCPRVGGCEEALGGGLVTLNKE